MPLRLTGKGKSKMNISEMTDFVLSIPEDFEEMNIARERMKHWKSKKGWTSWEDFEAELENNISERVFERI